MEPRQLRPAGRHRKHAGVEVVRPLPRGAQQRAVVALRLGAAAGGAVGGGVEAGRQVEQVVDVFQNQHVGVEIHEPLKLALPLPHAQLCPAVGVGGQLVRAVVDA
jgi:hypothetical protein